MKLFLSGDVMTGRGIDQVLPHRSSPELYEPFARSALEYVRLAEEVSGPIEKPVSWAYPWGEGLQVLERARPDARIVNLETSLTTWNEPAPKGIHYRMHPANVGLLEAAGIDCCVLSNNHVIDWGLNGLRETLRTLEAAGIQVAGAGADEAEAMRPARIEISGQVRVLVFGLCLGDSGVPSAWAAGPGRAGVNRIRDLSSATLDGLVRHIDGERRTGDRVVASIHWGGNWGYEISPEHRAFAHALIEEAGVDCVHGHSSHHPKAIEIHRDRPILYGCGDLLNDYEGISGQEAFRGELTLMYFPECRGRQRAAGEHGARSSSNATLSAGAPVGARSGLAPVTTAP